MRQKNVGCIDFAVPVSKELLQRLSPDIYYVASFDILWPPVSARGFEFAVVPSATIRVICHRSERVIVQERGDTDLTFGRHLMTSAVCAGVGDEPVSALG